MTFSDVDGDFSDVNPGFSDVIFFFSDVNPKSQTEHRLSLTQ
ncbi:hypothetical protein ACFPYN_15910 [Paenisporosarcina macmurdoensis]|uniref:Uncharacterized protein n=1 Tax=Paenisporosarcina macmurdoensis TaxID=212659 RepID=A0ABW1LBR6_9BACL